MTVLAEFSCTCTTPASELGGTCGVGSFSTAAIWHVNPSDILAAESDIIGEIVDSKYQSYCLHMVSFLLKQHP